MSESRPKPKVRPRPNGPGPMPEEPQRDPPFDLEEDVLAEEQNEKQGVVFDENHVPG